MSYEQHFLEYSCLESKIDLNCVRHRGVLEPINPPSQLCADLSTKDIPRMFDKPGYFISIDIFRVGGHSSRNGQLFVLVTSKLILCY